VNAVALEDTIADRSGDAERALRKTGGLCAVGLEPRVVGAVREHPAQAPLVAQGERERLSFPQVVLLAVEFPEWLERLLQVESKIDTLLLLGAALRKTIEHGQRLLEEIHRIFQSGPSGSLGSSLAKIRDGFLPQLAAQGMASQPFDVLSQPARIEALDRLYDPAMECAPLILEQTAIGHVVGQRVLEAVHEIGGDRSLVQELRGVQAADRGMQLVLRAQADRLEQGERNVLPND
jgi:hypothetical protein